MGVIDTGVDYTNPLFRYSDGSSRILRIWDQTVQDGTPPEGILYGAEYRKEEIDEALQAERPYDVVKLKEAKRYLREFFFVPEGVPAYQETDLMMAVSYLNDVANVLNMPLVICLALGNSMGGHGTDGPLSNFLNYISTRRRRSIVTRAGTVHDICDLADGRTASESAAAFRCLPDLPVCL